MNNCNLSFRKFNSYPFSSTVTEHYNMHHLSAIKHHSRDGTSGDICQRRGWNTYFWWKSYCREELWFIACLFSPLCQRCTMQKCYFYGRRKEVCSSSDYEEKIAAYTTKTVWHILLGEGNVIVKLLPCLNQLSFLFLFYIIRSEITGGKFGHST